MAERRKAIAFLFAVLIAGSSCAFAQADSAQAFTDSIQAAIKAKSIPGLMALTDPTGLNGNDRQDTDYDRLWAFEKDSPPIVSLGPLPPGFRPSRVENGKKYELLSQAAGIVYFQFPGEPAPRMTIGPYAIIGGKYVLLANHVSDVGWTGPPDQMLIFGFANNRRGTVRLVVNWNASGVEQSMTVDFKGGFTNSAVQGQYFEKATATGLDDEVDGKLYLVEGDKKIFNGLIQGRQTSTYIRP
jgi:hypothetical protein